VIELNFVNCEAYIELGRIYIEEEKYNQLDKLFERAIKLGISSYRIFIELGWFYGNQYNLERIEDSLKKAIESNLEDDRAYGWLAVLYKEGRKYGLDEKYFEEANEVRLKYYNYFTRENYRKIKEVLDKRSIKLVCVQYPMPRNANEAFFQWLP